MKKAVLVKHKFKILNIPISVTKKRFVGYRGLGIRDLTILYCLIMITK